MPRDGTWITLTGRSRATARRAGSSGPADRIKTRSLTRAIMWFFPSQTTPTTVVSRENTVATSPAGSVPGERSQPDGVARKARRHQEIMRMCSHLTPSSVASVPTTLAQRSSSTARQSTSALCAAAAHHRAGSDPGVVGVSLRSVPPHTRQARHQDGTGYPQAEHRREAYRRLARASSIRNSREAIRPAS